MGWDSWNKFERGISEDLVHQIADAMVSTGMKDAGYEYVNLDDCWAQLKRRDGHLQINPVLFPHGLKPLGDYIHSKGLKFGIYSCRGNFTCQKCSPGSHGFEIIDAEDFASWGVDYLKYDNCNPAFLTDQKGDYEQMKEALLASRRPIVFNICAWGFKDWMPYTGNLWRTTGDIRDKWPAVLDIIDTNEQWAKYAQPGGWNDPDMLEIGNGGMTDNEYRSHFSMWAMMAAPLITGNDLREMSKSTMEILLNKEVIAVDQDPLGVQGTEVWDNAAGLKAYSKKLTGSNNWAVAFLNRSNLSASVTVKWTDIGIPFIPTKVRDLWTHEYQKTTGNFYKAFVEPHGTSMLKIGTN